MLYFLNYTRHPRTHLHAQPAGQESRRRLVARSHPPPSALSSHTRMRSRLLPGCPPLSLPCHLLLLITCRQRTAAHWCPGSRGGRSYACIRMGDGCSITTAPPSTTNIATPATPQHPAPMRAPSAQLQVCTRHAHVHPHIPACQAACIAGSRASAIADSVGHTTPQHREAHLPSSPRLSRRAGVPFLAAPTSIRTAPTEPHAAKSAGDGQHSLHPSPAGHGHSSARRCVMPGDRVACAADMLPATVAEPSLFTQRTAVMHPMLWPRIGDSKQRPAATLDAGSLARPPDSLCCDQQDGNTHAGRWHEHADKSLHAHTIMSWPACSLGSTPGRR